MPFQQVSKCLCYQVVEPHEERVPAPTQAGDMLQACMAAMHGSALAFVAAAMLAVHARPPFDWHHIRTLHQRRIVLREKDEKKYADGSSLPR